MISESKIRYSLFFALCLLIQLSWAQQPDWVMTGTVTDENGHPIEGVTVAVKGTTKVTQTTK